MSRPKETEFFNWRYRRGWKWFSTHFDHYNGERVVGEASTRTMATPLAPERISKRLPDVKLVFLLRNPIERAYSAFWYYVAQGILCPNDDFSRFIRTEGHPLRQEIVHYGRYDEHLDRFLIKFDRSQMLILYHADLLSTPKSQIHKLSSFVGINAEPSLEKTIQKKNVTKYPSSSSAYAWAKSIWRPVRSAFFKWSPSVADAMQHAVKRLLLQPDRPPLSEADRKYLQQVYNPTIQNLKEDHDLNIPTWT
jgi:hypothetical protein